MEHKSRRPVDWEAFVLRYETKLYRTALAILGDAQEAEDAVQDTFLRYLEKAPVFSCPAQEAAWMTRVTCPVSSGAAGVSASTIMRCSMSAHSSPRRPLISSQ